MTKKFSDIIKLLNDIEHNVDVMSLNYKDIHYWPYIRNKIFISNQPVQNQASLQTRKLKKSYQKKIIPGVTWIYEWLEERARDREGDDIVHPADIFYLTHSFCRVQIGDQAVDRIFSPLIYWSQCLEGDCPTYMGHEYRPRGEYRSPRAERTIYIQSMILLYRKYARIKTKIAPQVLQEDLLDRVREYVHHFGMGRDIISSTTICLDMEYVYLLSEYYTRLLRRVHPKIVMAVTYYSTVGMALMVAANRLDIPTFDLQHGLQGIGHGAYSSFSVVPATGWDLLPRTFLNWRQEDADNINSWGAGIHRGAVLGIPWHDYIREDGYDIQHSEQLSALRSKGGNDNIILVSMQPLRDNSYFLSQLVDAIKSDLLATVYWLIRLHPGMVQDIPLYIEKFRFTNVDVKLATELPLPIIIDRSTLHVTRTSSVAIEAAMMGVRSLVERDCDLFMEYEESGYVGHWGLECSLASSVYKALFKRKEEKDIRVDFRQIDSRARYLQLLRENNVVPKQRDRVSP